MPGYKHSDVGIIPEEWEVRRIADVASVGSGGTPRREIAAYWGGSIPWITTTQIDFGLITEADQFITEEGLRNSAAKLLPVGTLLMALYGQGKTRGKVGVLGIAATTNQACAAITIQKGVSLDFILHYLTSRYEEIRNSSNSGSQENLNVNIVKGIPVAFPPFPEQRAIAQALSDADALLANLDRVIAKKRDLKQATMHKLLTGEKRLPGFSGDWELKSFGDLFDFSGGYSASRDQLSNEGHCYLHYGDIHGSSKTSVNTRLDFLDIPKLDISLGRISEGSLLKHGDVVFVDASEDDAGTSKHLVIENEDDVPFISGLHTIVAKSRANDLAHAYKHYCFQTRLIRQQFMFYAVGTKVSGISKTNIAKLTLPIPSIPEQIAIADVLSSMDIELANLEARRYKTRNINQAMMQELLAGNTRLV